MPRSWARKPVALAGEAGRILRARGVVYNRRSSNKELEPTRSTPSAVGPRGSIQCWAGYRGEQ